jgi:NAD(P)-dependent dehydrogenase (short-subunit alcohol dehydrogenase family)
MTAPKQFSLSGKRVLVTGASSGIGRQVALSCAQAGATVILTGRDETRLREALAELGGGAHAQFACDLNDDAGVKALAHQAGTIDGVVHCAGVAMSVPLRMASREHIENMFRINTVAPMLLTQQLLLRNAINTGGSIVFISSISATAIGVPGISAYSGSKAGLESMARCLSMEVAKRKIRVNCLAPGFVETPMLQRGREHMLDAVEDTALRYPLGIGQPEDVANAAIFFLSQASRWITGTSLVLDGGHTVR